MKTKSKQNVTLHIGLMMTGQSFFMALAESKARVVIVGAYTSRGLSSKKETEYFEFCRANGARNFVLLINGKHGALFCANNGGSLFTLDESSEALKDLLKTPAVRERLGASA